MSSLQIETLPLGPLQTNCYLVTDPDTQDTIIIDPGSDAPYIKKFLQDMNLKPQSILATHGHFDHILAIASLQADYKLPFYVSQKDEFLVQNLSQEAEKYLGLSTIQSPQITGYLTQAKPFKLNRHSFTVLSTPGHTPGGISLYHAPSKAVFVGDLLFAAGGIGRYDYPYSDPDVLKKSLQTILTLPLDTTVFPGHGLLTSIKESLSYFSDIH